MSDLTTKAIKVSRRICEIEERLACLDLTGHEADDLRYEKAELEELDEVLSAYFNARNNCEQLQSRCAELERERDELEAYVERIKTHADAVVFGADKERLHSGKTVYIIPFEHIESFANTVNQSPKTILAEHDAEVMAKSIEDFADSFNGDKSEWVTYQAFKSSAYQYANKIRNSNGGE